MADSTHQSEFYDVAHGKEFTEIPQRDEDRIRFQVSGFSCQATDYGMQSA
jgi:hypothetical protein